MQSFVDDSLFKMSLLRVAILLVYGCLLQCSFSENRSCQQQISTLETLLRLLAIRRQNNYSSQQPRSYSPVPYPYCKTTNSDYSLNIAQRKAPSGLGPEYQIRLPLYMGRPVKTNIILELPLSKSSRPNQGSATGKSPTTPNDDYSDPDYDCSLSTSPGNEKTNNGQPSESTSETGATTSQGENNPSSRTSTPEGQPQSSVDKATTECSTANDKPTSSAPEIASLTDEEITPVENCDTSNNNQDSTRVSSDGSSPVSGSTISTSKDVSNIGSTCDTTTNAEAEETPEQCCEMKPADNDDTVPNPDASTSSTEQSKPSTATENSSPGATQPATTTTSTSSTTTTTATGISEGADGASPAAPTSTGDGAASSMAPASTDDGASCIEPSASETTTAEEADASSTSAAAGAETAAASAAATST